MADRPKRGQMVDPLENLLGYQLRRASLVVMDDLYNALAEVDLSPAMASVLMVIEANPDIKLIEVGRCLDIKRANMTPLIAKLEARGLVARVAADGRSHALKLTADGRSTVAKVHRLIAKHEKRCLGCLSDKAQQQMKKNLNILRS